MPIEIKMPALSPTMEEGTLAKWLVKEGDTVKSGDIMAEIETDKATMEFEAVDEGTIAKILIAEGTDGVKVGTAIAILAEDGEDASAPVAKAETPAPADPQFKGTPPANDPNKTGSEAAPVARDVTQAEDHGRPADAQKATGAGSSGAGSSGGDRVKASPLARRLAADKGIDLAGVSGSGPNGRIVRADLDGAKAGSAAASPAIAAATARKDDAPSTAAPAPKPAAIPDIPHELAKLSNVRKTIARRLTESKQTVPHIYLTVDIRLDALLKLRGELNHSLEARGVKLSVNDMLVKALGVALIAVPKCNVMFTP
ncbi:MAG TPA: biotin/lipoyl-containing protein, partial [Sphingomonas sp.]|nr:biotin/lipoyl-containing protein [Sphingomonas sp.]